MANNYMTNQLTPQWLNIKLPQAKQTKKYPPNSPEALS